MPEIHNGGKDNIFNSIIKLNFHLQRINWILIIYYIQIKTQDLNIRPEDTKFIEQNLEENLYYIGLINSFANITTKISATEA